MAKFYITGDDREIPKAIVAYGDTRYNAVMNWLHRNIIAYTEDEWLRLEQGGTLERTKLTSIDTNV